VTTSQTPEEEHQEHLELIHQLHDAGWGIAETVLTADGTRHRYRDWPWTSDWDGMQTRWSFGKTYNESIRNFLDELQQEREAAKAADK
jgi:hypothetical protein